MKRIIFLDVDGVLNSGDWLKRRPSKEQFAAEHDLSPEVCANCAAECCR